MRSVAGTASSPRRTASCAATHEASGQAAVVGATRCRTSRTDGEDGGRQRVAAEQRAAGPVAASARPAAHAASVSSELRSPRPGGAEGEPAGGDGQREQQETGRASRRRPTPTAAAGADEQHGADAEQDLRRPRAGRQGRTRWRVSTGALMTASFRCPEASPP